MNRPDTRTGFLTDIRRRAKPFVNPTMLIIGALIGFFLLTGQNTTITGSGPSPYVPTDNSVVERMLGLAQVDAGDVVMDIGAGDGRIVIAAARRGARAIGVELDPETAEMARRNVEAAGLKDLVEIRVENGLETDVSETTVVTMYLLQELTEAMGRRLQQDLQPGARIVTHAFTLGIDDWWPERAEVFEYETNRQASLHLWRVPTRH